MQENIGPSNNQGSYVPPRYIPLGQSDTAAGEELLTPFRSGSRDTPTATSARWSSGICACFDDISSCYVGLFCPCFLFGKNAEALGSGTFVGSCMTHFLMWALVNTVCCILTDGILMGLPGCFVACYACGYRKTLRSKYNLEESPCGDFTSHFFCHLCATCQEYRELRERSDGSHSPDVNLTAIAAPEVQKMESTSNE